MELSWLQTFLIAAQYGNFRKAADVLFLSQPSVTVHIQNLEKELGVQLFLREKKRVELTKAGKRFIPHAQLLLTNYQNGIADMQSYSQGYSSQLSIAISPLIADTILPFVLKKYMTEHPHVEVSVKVVEALDIEREILADEVDIGLSCVRSNNPDLVCEVISKDKVLLIAPHDGIDSESAPVLEEEEVLTSNYLLTDNHPVYWEELNRHVRKKYPKIKTMKVSQIHVTKRFIVEGLGVSFLPESTVRKELLEGWLLEVPCPSIKLPEACTYVIMKDSHPKKLEFMAFLQNYRI